jgi:hypothetical protein
VGSFTRSYGIKKYNKNQTQEIKMTIEELKYKANDIRQDIIEMLLSAGSGHSAGPLGMADVFTALYFEVMKHDPKNPKMPGRDRLVLSCGHICPVLYASLAEAGYFEKSELKTLRKLGTRLHGHPHNLALPQLTDLIALCRQFDLVDSINFDYAQFVVNDNSNIADNFRFHFNMLGQRVYDIDYSSGESKREAPRYTHCGAQGVARIEARQKAAQARGCFTPAGKRASPIKQFVDKE